MKINISISVSVSISISSISAVFSVSGVGERRPVAARVLHKRLRDGRDAGPYYYYYYYD